MQTALKLTSTVQPGGRIEIFSPQFPAGQAVDIIVVLPQVEAGTRQSVTDILAAAPGHLAFQNAEAVDAYAQEERDAWDR